MLFYKKIIMNKKRRQENMCWLNQRIKFNSIWISRLENDTIGLSTVLISSFFPQQLLKGLFTELLIWCLDAYSYVD